jgi:hypothetical protein
MTMTILTDQAFPRTLDTLVRDLTTRQAQGLVEAWVFEDTAARRAAETELTKNSVTAIIRSAYKPLLFFFLEAVDRADLRSVVIRYPRHSAAHPDRFLMEAYPLAALLEGTEVSFIPGDEPLTYEVALTHRNGEVAHHQVFAPNMPRDGALAVCGWLRQPGESDAAMPTEFETLFQTAVAVVRAQGWTGRIGAFDRLTLQVEMPGADQEIGWGDEVISFREAMHEDLFFTLREMLAAHPDEDADRLARPGQIVPDIRASRGDARLRITGSIFDEAQETVSETLDVATADRPLGMAQIRAVVAALGGEPISAQSREGREVVGLYKPGPAPAVLITAGQHANETSGVVGGLRAAQALMLRPESHFAYIPVENVDGYELHQRLISQNPRHMHHAARFTALGDDLSVAVAEPDYERCARHEALARSGAKLHINLHGYPSHEWTRPLNGYLPKGFESWTIPKGFFLILAHHPGWAEAADTLLDVVSATLADDAELVAFNRRQINAVRTYVHEEGFQVRNDIACYMSEATTYATPLTLITEAPDETIYGAAFVMQQQAQLRAALACVDAYARLAL